MRGGSRSSRSSGGKSPVQNEIIINAVAGETRVAILEFPYVYIFSAFAPEQKTLTTEQGILAFFGRNDFENVVIHQNNQNAAIFQREVDIDQFSA